MYDRAMNPVRPLLLAMAGSRTWKRLLTGWSVTHRVVARFVPGETLDDALGAVRQLNADGMSATLNPLGESVNGPEEATAATDAYIEILERIEAERLDSTVSVKLTLMGLDLGAELARANLERVLLRVADLGNFVRIDMEASEYVDATLELHRTLRERFDNFGLVVQSYLLRTEDDVEALVRSGTSLRIVKGAYNEPDDVALVGTTPGATVFAWPSPLMIRLSWLTGARSSIAGGRRTGSSRCSMASAGRCSDSS